MWVCIRPIFNLFSTIHHKVRSHGSPLSVLTQHTRSSAVLPSQLKSTRHHRAPLSHSPPSRASVSLALSPTSIASLFPSLRSDLRIALEMSDPLDPFLSPFDLSRSKGSRRILNYRTIQET
ncbi:uncharacterized protein LOC125316487 [Rhodamnia argentea]|uniref:Uncharacterized protein LOC125316487 n=1 Tax=Rhodamnia argentea TaxID=178133 RepID=A0ABM3HW13_9MYRT|nr:uncharacterized protein LOC125316487 [Rhodamnia argentea]